MFGAVLNFIGGIFGRIISSLSSTYLTRFIDGLKNKKNRHISSQPNYNKILIVINSGFLVMVIY